MSGETDLAALLRLMRPALEEEEYVFCRGQGSARDWMMRLHPLGIFQEAEGWTLIVTRKQALEAGLSFGPVFRRITLSVHSSLEAVGFLAAVTEALAQHGISVNAVSAYYHDHLFVPVSRAEEAMHVLNELSGS
ncbi:MAG TPA: ACT domain-containing protein [Acidobacteriota bacterium]|nr:ACT domain-containing protein [Acidobacteriota bacterium]